MSRFFLFSLTLLFSILLDNLAYSTDKNGRDGVDGKIIDDPYLAMEKESDIDSVDVYQLAPGEVPMAKINPYKPIKRQKEWTKKEEADRKDLFEEMATFNYGVIGMLKKRMESAEKKLIGSGERNAHSGKASSSAEENTADRKPYQEESSQGHHWQSEEKEEPDLDTVGWFD